MSGTIVLVSGTSGAGKTTVTRTFARRADEMYLMLGLDLLVGTMFPGQYTIFGSKREEGFTGSYGAPGWRAVQAMHEMIAAASRLGQNMVVDHMVFLDPPVLQDCIWRLEDRPVLFVNLRVPFEVVEARLEEKARHRKLSETMIEEAGRGERSRRDGRGARSAEVVVLRAGVRERLLRPRPRHHRAVRRRSAASGSRPGLRKGREQRSRSSVAATRGRRERI